MTFLYEGKYLKISFKIMFLLIHNIIETDAQTSPSSASLEKSVNDDTINLHIIRVILYF